MMERPIGVSAKILEGAFQLVEDYAGCIEVARLRSATMRGVTSYADRMIMVRWDSDFPVGSAGGRQEASRVKARVVVDVQNGV